MSQSNQNTDLEFAYWVPNVSGGLVISDIEQRTSWDIDYNRKLARLAENSGFDYALSQIRFTAGYGAEFQHEPVSFTHALLAATERLKVIPADALRGKTVLAIASARAARHFQSVQRAFDDLYRFFDVGFVVPPVFLVDEQVQVLNGRLVCGPSAEAAIERAATAARLGHLCSRAGDPRRLSRHGR